MSDRQASGAMRPRTYSGRIQIPERFHCEAERRSRRFRIDLECEDIGEELLALRKKAYDLYGARCLWNIPGHATTGGMRGIATSLQTYGDLNAARLVADILRKHKCTCSMRWAGTGASRHRKPSGLACRN